MNEAPSKLEPSDGLVLTNPVWSLRELSRKHWDVGNPGASRAYADNQRILWEQKGVVLRDRAVATLIDEGILPDDAVVSGPAQSPRIVGLVVHPRSNDGFVNPILAEPNARWTRSPCLPFHPTDIQTLLVRLLHAARHEIESAVPEALAFHFDEKLQLDCTGQSMHVAALLAVLDAMDGRRSDTFSCACSLVQPGPESLLVPVESVRSKLLAFRREFGRGSLLVRNPGCSESEEFCADFECVWNVDSLDDLCSYLERGRVLDALLQAEPLTVAQVHVVLERLRYLMDDEFDNAGAFDLVKRITASLPAEGLPVRLEATLAARHEDVHRHKGEFAKALELSTQFQSRLSKLGDASCYEDEIKVATRIAAGLFDQHDFNRVVGMLTPFYEQCISNPRMVSADSRAHLFNTLARTRVVLAIDGWEELFYRSVDLQERVYPPDLTKTRNYLAHAFLRAGRPEDAEIQIESVECSHYCDAYSTTFSHFHRAELARQRMEVWPEFPESIDGLIKDHAYAFFLQACARQQGRSPDSAVELLMKAEETLERSIQDDSPENILWFLASCIALKRAACAHDNSEWQSRVSRIRRYLAESGNACMQTYYRDVCSELTEEPSHKCAESLLLRIPYL